MGEQEVTYATVRFHKSSGLQNQVRPEETQRPKKAGHRDCSVPWKPIVIVLGILCSLLLVTVAVLVTHIFQYRQEKREQEQMLNNFHQLYQITKNNNSLMKERLKNKSLECDTCKNTLNNLKRIQNRCYKESKIDLNCFKYKGQVEERWFCCGLKCYYFVIDNEQWNRCQQICKAFNLSLLKIDDDDELNFLKSQLQGNRFWIGLTHNKSQKKGQWTVDPPKLNLSGVNLPHYRGNCAFLNSFQIENDDCAKTHGCICEKRLNKFPISVACVNPRTQIALKSDERERDEMYTDS